MPAEELLLHPYDILANPKRRRILDALEKEQLTYTELMQNTGIEDSGKLSYHLGLLSSYVLHEKDLYSLSIEGRILARAVRDFEERTYGVMSNIIFSGQCDPTGLLKAAACIRISIMTPEGDLIRKMAMTQGFDREKAETLVRSSLQSGIGPLLGKSLPEDVSVDFDNRGLAITFELEKQGYEQKGDWLVEQNPQDLLSPEVGDGRPFPVPGLHYHITGTILCPEHAIVERDPLETESLEEKGIQVFELTRTDQNIRWRVQKGSALYLGESKLVPERNRTRGVHESETHLLVKEPTTRGEINRDMRVLMRAVSTKTRFKPSQSEDRGTSL